MFKSTARQTVREVVAATSSERASLTARTFASSSRVQASQSSPRKKKAKAPPNPDAMPLNDAIQVLRALEISNPTAAYSVTLQTKVNKSSLLLRGRITLPVDPRPKPEVILILTDPVAANLSEAYKKAGASFIGADELFPKVLSGEISPTKVLTTQSMLPSVSKSLARYLGPKGLMPVVKRGTVAKDEEAMVAAIREVGGGMDWRGDKQGAVRAPVARTHHSIEAVDTNVRTFIQAVREGTSTGPEAASASKGKKSSAILKALLETTNGPSIELNDVL